MQTFLNETTFEASARALDSKRINKQLFEGFQMLNAIAGNQKGFANHPATNMWRGYEYKLLQYLKAIKDECAERGIKHDVHWAGIGGLFDDDEYHEQNWMVSLGKSPEWWLDPLKKDRILWTHRANLHRKDPEHYADYYVDWLTYEQMLAERPTGVVCCEKRRRVPGLSGLQPCQYWWPTHLEE